MVTVTSPLIGATCSLDLMLRDALATGCAHGSTDPRSSICDSPAGPSVRQRTQQDCLSTLVQHCDNRHPAVPNANERGRRFVSGACSGAPQGVVRLRDVAKWVVLHLDTDEASTYINVDAVNQVRQVSVGSTRISFSDGTDVSVREDAPIVIAAFRRDSI